MRFRSKNVAIRALTRDFRLSALALLVTALGAGACSSSMSTASTSQADTVQAQVNAYVANENNNTVSVIDTASNKITATIPVGAFRSAWS